MHLLQKTLYYIHIKNFLKMFCERRHYKKTTCFGHYSMTILRRRPSFLKHPPPISRLLRHSSFSGLWPYALYLYVCPVFISGCCLVLKLPDHTLCLERHSSFFLSSVRFKILQRKRRNTIRRSKRRCYNENFLPIKSGYYHDSGGILSDEVTRAYV
jgi:hypothetical protein